MAVKEQPRGGTLVRCNIMGDLYLYVLRFETNDTSAPDGAEPSGSVTLGRSDVGDLTVTFDESVKPKVVHACWPMIEENSADDFIKPGGYTASSGVYALHLYTNSSGTIASADTDDQTIVCVMLCNKSDLGD